MKKYLKFIVLLMCAELLYGQNPSADQNYILIKTPLIETSTTDGLSYTDCMQTINYFDGLGRPIQTVQRGFTAGGKDLVIHQEYDAYGRKGKSWLPVVVSGNNGAYVSQSDIKANSLITYSGDGYPYTRSVYEKSPLNRVLEEWPAGDELGGDGYCIEIEYLANTSSNTLLNCIQYTASSALNDTLVTIKRKGNYSAGQLYVVKKVYWHTRASAYEFKDKLGRVVLKRFVAEQNTLYDTYYVYDDFGNLTAVIPPLAADEMKIGTSWNNTDSIIRNYAYLYQFDGRNRCITKRLPGASWVYYIYDKADKLILVQDGELRAAGKWKFNISDAAGRGVLTGLCKSSLSPFSNTVKNNVVKATRTNATDSYKGYSVDAFVPATEVEILTVNYYDDYSFIGTNGISSTVTYNAESSCYDTRYRGSYKGLLTGTLTAQIGPDGVDDTYLYSVMYYDSRGRLIQTKSNSYLDGGVEREYLAYNFAGQPVKKKLMHEATGRSMQTQNLTYEYDHGGRLTKQTHQGGMFGRIIPIENEYDELGRVSKTRRNDRDRLSGTYHYDIHSRLTAIKEYHFHEYLTYGLDGNVETMEWKHGNQTRKYTFAYDNQSRLTTASFEGTGVGWENFSTAYNYDKHGNITQLQRNGRIHYGDVASSYGLVDDMTLQYTGNQLMNVTDAGAFVGLSESNDFKKYSSANPGYAYNQNGAMTKDLNKGISSISYNVLNLPQVMDIKNPVGEGRNTYTYAADGRKLKLEQQWNSNYSTTPTVGTAINTSNLNQTKDTEYIGSIVYDKVNGRLTKKTVYFDGGYAEGGNYYFYLRNHLGSVVIVAKEDDSVVQNVLYYPFGAPLTPFCSARHVQPYKFGGKEFDMMHGLNWYDFSARHYDAAYGRFTTPDPLSEKKPWLSPYHYCSNNPMGRVDPSGLTDYSFDKKTGVVKQVGEMNNDPDRIVKITKKGETKVRIDNIEKGILKDGMNFKTNNNMIAAGGKGQPSVKGVESFVLKLSDFVGREIGGTYFSVKGLETTLISVGRYANNSRKETKGHGSNLASYVNPSWVKAFPFMKKTYEIMFKMMTPTHMFHTHPTVGVSVTDRTKASRQDYNFRDAVHKLSPHMEFFILTQPTSYGGEFPYKIPYTTGSN